MNGECRCCKSCAARASIEIQFVRLNVPVCTDTSITAVSLYKDPPKPVFSVCQEGINPHNKNGKMISNPYERLDIISVLAYE